MELIWLVWVLAGLLIAVGLAGTVLPMLPGVPLMFVGMWLVAWIGGFERIGTATVWVLGILAVVSVLVDLLASALGAQRVGASRWGLVGAFAGTVVGLFFGLAGILIGPLIGAVAGELIARPELHGAARVGVATWAGILVGALFKVAIAFVMLGLFLFALLL